MSTNIPPRFPNQEKTFQFLIDSKGRTLDLSDPGTGKTRPILEYCQYRRHNGGKRTLVLTMKSLIEAAWLDDSRKFCPGLILSPAYAHNRAQAFKQQADVYVTNVDAVKWIADQPRSFFSNFDQLVLDEFTAFKHRTSQRSKAVRKIAKYFDVRHGMSGTPTSNMITDIWHPALLIDDGERLGNNFFAFRSATQNPIQVGPRPEHRKWVDKPNIAATVAGLLADISIRHDFDECFDVPNTFREIKYRLTPKHRKLYKEFEENALLDLHDTKVVGVNAASVAQKLLQISSGAVYDEDQEAQVLDTSRYELIMDLVEARPHTIVFFLWTHQRAALAELAAKRKYSYSVMDGNVRSSHTRAQITRDFQAGKYKVLFLHPKTGAHGLTLTKAKTAIWASPPVDAEWWKQGNYRIKRAVQDSPVETILVSAPDTREDIQYDNLMGKYGRMLTFLEVLEI